MTDILLDPIIIQEVSPVDVSKTNPSIVLAYDVNGDVQYITKTISGVQYRKTLTWTARVLTGISSWVQL